MSVLYSGTMQGRFTSDGTAKTIMLRPDIDWMHVYNLTTSYALGASTGVEFYWQRGMTQGRGTIYVKTTADSTLEVHQTSADSGFFLVDSSLNVPGAARGYTAVSSGNPPVVSTTNTAGLINGQTIVRMQVATGANGNMQLGGLDFTVGTVVGNTSFQLKYMVPIVAGQPDSYYRIIPFDPIFYPRSRFISAITQAQQAVVTLTVTHGYQIGQVVRFVVPRVSSVAYGMTELDGVQATIVDVDTAANTITVNVDTTSMDPFVFPLTGDYPFTPAQVIPVGANTAVAIANNQDVISDSIVNEAYLGLKLMAGTGSPAGVDGDVIYWRAGKSFNVDNELVTNP